MALFYNTYACGTVHLKSPAGISGWSLLGHLHPTLAFCFFTCAYWQSIRWPDLLDWSLLTFTCRQPNRWTDLLDWSLLTFTCWQSNRRTDLLDWSLLTFTCRQPKRWTDLLDWSLLTFTCWQSNRWTDLLDWSLLTFTCWLVPSYSQSSSLLSSAGAATIIIFFATTSFVTISIHFSWQKTCFVTTNTYLSRQKLVATKLLFRQNYVCRNKYLSWQWFCHDKNMFVMTNKHTFVIRVCRDKTFVATKMILVAAPA